MAMTIKFRGWLAKPRMLCLGVACAVPVLYARWVRPRLLTWGITRDEASSAYPGDEFIPDPANTIWGFHLRPAPGGSTRLVIRKRGRGPRAVTWPVGLLWDPGHFIMQTRQFRNLRTRVGAQV